MTDDDIRERILDLADDLRDMGGRIANLNGEVNYSAEKAWRAAKAAVRIMAIADARTGVPPGSDNSRFAALDKAYVDELREHGIPVQEEADRAD